MSKDLLKLHAPLTPICRRYPLNQTASRRRIGCVSSPLQPEHGISQPVSQLKLSAVKQTAFRCRRVGDLKDGREREALHPSVRHLRSLTIAPPTQILCHCSLSDRIKCRVVRHLPRLLISFQKCRCQPVFGFQIHCLTDSMTSLVNREKCQPKRLSH